MFFFFYQQEVERLIAREKDRADLRRERSANSRRVISDEI